MTKTLCDLKKLLKSEVEEFQALVVNGTHYCEKCGRVANSKKRLCRPARIKIELPLINRPE